ncbi:hypothetical protein C8Q78DRAFT_524387 [Trametes maxima]|nr:hypothetical protein C8Q78DRAFT_524387 [Trametes maxima]
MPPRKKARTTVSKKAAEQASADNRAGASSSTGPGTPSESPTEQAVVVKPFRNVRGRRGGLEDMPKMPIDILLEIMGLLHPRDLLNLARTTRDFRAFLMSRNSASLWKAARKAVPDLPDLPPWLSEPAYANLMFFPYCHGCLKPNIQRVYWMLCARYCNEACAGSKLIRPMYFPAAFKRARASLEKLDSSLNPDLFLVYQPLPANRRHSVCSRSEVEEFCREWEKLGSDADKLRFAKERQERVRERIVITGRLSTWADDCKSNRREELRVLRDERFDEIVTRLRQEGWGPDFHFMSMSDEREFSMLASVNKAAKLTDKAWNNARDGIYKYMQTFRNRRLQDERRQRFIVQLKMMRQALAEHLSSLGHGSRPRTIADELLPFLGDFVVMPQFRPLLFAEPSEPDTVTVETFASIFRESWDDLVAAWREDRKAKFLKDARGGLSGTAAADADDPLGLAIASFSCRIYCISSMGMRWPDVLAHPCLRPTCAPHGWRSVEDADDLWFALERVCGRGGILRGYPASNVVVFNQRLSMMRDVISVCGQDPDTVSWDAMQACPVRLTCRICAQARTDRRQVFDWLAAVTHYYSTCVAPAATEAWEIVEEEYAARARALEPALLLKRQSREPEGYGHWYACAWCSKEPLRNARDMARHVRTGHEKTPVAGVDVYLMDDLRASTGMPPVWMYSEALAEDEKVKRRVEAGKGFFVSFLPGPPPPETGSSEGSEVVAAASD